MRSGGIAALTTRVFNEVALKRISTTFDTISENLIYCCTTCNRIKGDFWATAPDEKRLLHPQQDELSLHLHQEANGMLSGLTETGKFHVQRLRLNRAPLVALRQTRMMNAKLHEELSQIQSAQKKIMEQLQRLDGEMERIYREITRLLKE